MASRRYNLLPPYLAANPAWVQLVESIDEVFENEVDLPTELLAKLRDNWILGAAGEAKIGDERMLDNDTDWFRFERETLVRQANQLGFLLKETDLLTDKEYQRVVRNLGAFWYNKGTPEFIDFIRFILGAIIDIRKLFALPGPTYDTYGFMREEGDSLIGKLNYEFEEEFEDQLPTGDLAAETVPNGGIWIQGPNISYLGSTTGPTGADDAVILQSNALTGAYMSATDFLENNTTYDFEVWVRRLSAAPLTTGHQSVNSDFDNIADATERITSDFGVVPLVWTKKSFRFTTGMFASVAPSTIAYTAGVDVGAILAYAQPQLKKVTKTAVAGQWFETSHVNLVVDPLQYVPGTLQKVVALFYALANYHLVLNTIMFEFIPYIHPPGEDIGVILKAYPMIDIEPTIYSSEDFDPPTVVNVSSPTWLEGGDLIFNVTLNKTSTIPNSYTYTQGGTATPDVDYSGPVFTNGVALVAGKVQVPPGVSSFSAKFVINLDFEVDPNETIIVTIDGQVGTGTITDLDVELSLQQMFSDNEGVFNSFHNNLHNTLPGPGYW
jgi:hypothetical protein